MSSIRTQSFRRVALDHFEPEDASDPQAQRRIRGQLEQIDYIAFAANKELIGATLGPTDAKQVQRLAVAVAHARATWLAEALALADRGPAVSAAEGQRLAGLRATFDELAEAYEALRRVIERSYVTYRPAAPAA